MPLPERTLRNKVLKKLKEHGIMVISVSDKYRSGTPDMIVIDPLRVPDSVYFIELKAEKGIVSKIQEVTFKDIMQHGGIVYIIRSVEELYTKNIIRKENQKYARETINAELCVS